MATQHFLDTPELDVPLTDGTTLDLKLRVGGSLLNPHLLLGVPISSNTRKIGKTAGSVLQTLDEVATKLKESGLVTHMTNAAHSLETISNKIKDVLAGQVDYIGAIDFVFEVSTTLISLSNLIAGEKTPQTILMLVFSVYKLIKALIFKLPASLRTLWYVCFDGEKQEEDEEEQFEDCLVAEANGAINLAYAGLISLLPFKIRKILETYQQYTRIRILEDLDWVYSIADAVLHVPSFICRHAANLADKLPGDWAKRSAAILAQGADKYESLLTMFPELTSMRLVEKLTTCIGKVLEDRRLLADRTFMTEFGLNIEQAHEHVNRMHQMGRNETSVFMAALTEAVNLHKKGLHMIKPSHPEPAAVLLYSQPGEGKTFFIQRLRKHLTASGKNTIYDYTPTEGRSDFHDMYQNQNVWIHEDIGQRNVSDWGQYIIHIGTNPSRMDGASLNNKSTIFFESQVILGTTNIPIHHSVLRKELNCGWTDENAIYRRWTVVLYKRDCVACPSRIFDPIRQVWHAGPIFNVADPEQFTNQLYNMRLQKVKEYEQIIAQDEAEPISFSFGEISADDEQREVEVAPEQVVQDANRSVRARRIPNAEGRTRKVVVAQELQDLAPEQTVYPKYQKVETNLDLTSIGVEKYLDFYDMSDIAQAKVLSKGWLINGGSQIVGEGAICITEDVSTWYKWLQTQYEHMFDYAAACVPSILDFLKSGFETLMVTVGKKTLIMGGFVAGLGILSTMLFAWYRSSRVLKDAEYEPFVAYGRVGKRNAAKDIFAEVKTKLSVTAVPNDTLKAIQRNVIRCEYTYDRVTSYSYAMMIDANTMIAPAHSFLGGNSRPNDIFIRGEDSEDREVISTFFKPLEWNMEMDYVVLQYASAHATIFRDMKNQIIRQPTSAQLYLLLAEGAISIGTMDRASFTSGSYKYRSHKFEVDKLLVHKYDGQATSAEGLCGAPVVTLDGFIVGWHVAGDADGSGFARVWPMGMKKLLYDAEDTVPQINLVPSEHKGVMITDDKTYHHVNLKSTFVPSAMLAPMLEQPALVDENGMPYRMPCELGGKVITEDGLTKRTYDVSRMKNFSKVDRPVNMQALDFATSYIRSLLTKFTKGKAKKLTDAELVLGVKDDFSYVNSINKDASAGVPWGVTIDELVDGDKLDKRVLQEMDRIEKLARQGKKDPSLVKFKDCDKDEMRDSPKTQKPRCFAAGPVHYTMLLRRWFGRIGAQMMPTRQEHGIMIGINATSSEWQTLWSSLIKFPNHFDGDYAKWDGAMRREFQERLNMVLSEFTEDPIVAHVLLTYLCETTHVGMDMTYLTTHSVPSGHGLTAFYNSLINKMYVAYAWYILVGQYLQLGTASLIAKLDATVFAPVYGDDILCAVSDDIKEKFNAITYGAVMTDLGLGFTSASKKPHSQPFCMLRDLTFLKRKFVANRLLGAIVGPLEISVLKASCGFTRDATRDREITDQKMTMIQRELFLHTDTVYNIVWSSLKECYESAYGAPYTNEILLTNMLEIYKKNELRSDLFALAESGLKRAMPSKRKNKRFAQF